MAKLTLTPATSLTNETSFIQVYNDNLESIEDAVELTLSRNGLSPNTMTANLDMNSFRILNIPAPVDDNDLVRLIDIDSGIKGDKGDKGDPGNSVLSTALQAIEDAEPAAADKIFAWTGSSAGAFVTATAAGLALLDDASNTAQRTTLGLGDSATKNTGTTPGTVAAGNDSRFYQYTINPQNGAYTFLNADFVTPTLITHSSASAHIYYIPSTPDIPVGCQVTVYNDRTSLGALYIDALTGSNSLYINGSTTSTNAVLDPGAVANLLHYSYGSFLLTGPGVSVV